MKYLKAAGNDNEIKFRAQRVNIHSCVSSAICHLINFLSSCKNLEHIFAFLE